MSNVTDPQSTTWTAVDLVHRFGPIPLTRVRNHPAPGTATDDDVVRIHDAEDRLYELVEGTLLEKAVGTYKSFLAMTIGAVLSSFVVENKFGIVLGADGMLRLAPGLVRIPDVSFISWERLPGRLVPRTPIADLVPDLAVEVISAGNTREEMDRKLGEYFAAGTRLVWYVYPAKKEVHVFTSPDQRQVLAQDQSLAGGDVLPSFTLPIATIFAEPGRDEKAEN
jgi:Uma2 family endonuclease